MTIQSPGAGSNSVESGWLIALKVIVRAVLGSAALLITGLAYLYAYVMPANEEDPDAVVAQVAGLSLALFLGTVVAIMVGRYKVTWLLYQRDARRKGSGMKDTGKSGETTKAFTDEERAAMKERAREVKTARRGSRASKADEESDVLAKIAEMPEPDRSMAERLHAVIKSSAPTLSPKLWYGMPAYAKDGKVVCFFQSAEKFKSRYATLGFNDIANLDEGTMWPTAFALAELTAADEARIGALVQKAAS
ncbi:hypothetical protein Acor_64700 [Acrocarpospora corrugata]|uniref:Uncharacterized protein n=1 Tax=Acrocarpospora corrugata TaxID=35763 RepID=A0A5M3W8S1_9ACTN|nr:DUF1801 domain-containing protein [Acrocarpospora corrugata]GES04402.1 hypothetical protein Acor_64700 [Acrocarpospora corrugata]